MRTPSPIHGTLCLERVLGRARLLLVAGILTAAYLDVLASGRANTAYVVFASYGAWSVGLAIVLQFVASVNRAQQRVIGAIDLIAAMAVATTSIEPGTSVSAIILFVVVADACRTGRRGAVVSTASIGVALIGARMIMAVTGGPTLPLSVFAIRLTYLFIAGFLVASLAELHRDRMVETEAVVAALGCIRDARTYVRAVAGVSEQLTQLFDARSVVVSIQSPAADRYCWHVLRSEGTPPEIRSIDAPHDPGNYVAITGPEPHTTLHYRDDGRRGVACIGNAPMLTRPRLTATPKFWASLGCESVLEHSVELDDGWRVRVFLVDPKSYQSGAAAVHLLHALYGQIAPALLKMFLSRRLRSQVLTRERARFARELHDRVVQALIALEIQVTVLTRRAAARPVLAQLEELQRNLRVQVDDVRELMRDVRPLRLKGTEVPAYIEALVERFEKRSDIHAHFECDVDRIDLMPHACGELVRLIEEALVNVQKHSGASEVLVSLKRGTNSLELTVIDNGRGFEFDGGMAPYTLPPHERPRVIEERANAIGALLSIQSRPGSGARLDVTLPYAS